MSTETLAEFRINAGLVDIWRIWKGENGIRKGVPHTVNISAHHGPFTFQDYLTPDEAWLLADALRDVARAACDANTLEGAA